MANGFTNDVQIKEYFFNERRYWFVADEFKLKIFEFKKFNIYSELETNSLVGKSLYTKAFFMILFTPWLYMDAKKFNKHLAKKKTSWYNA